MLSALHGEIYQPKGTCENCGKVLSPFEVIQGFTSDVNDFTTKCPKCESRFEPQLICFRLGTRIEIPFYCDVQSLEKLKEMTELSPLEISEKHPGVYRSTIVHYGSLAKAFSEVNVDYKFSDDEINGWETKISPFLGKLKDVQIASAARVDVSKVRKLRTKLGIKRFTLEQALEDAQ